MACPASKKSTDSSDNIGFEADFSPPAPAGPNTFRRDLHPDPARRDADYVLANPPFSDSETALHGGAYHQSEAKPQVVGEAKDNFRKDDYPALRDWQFAVAPKGVCRKSHLIISNWSTN